MKVEFTKDWCMNMAKIEARAAELHESCRMPMEQARELAVSEAGPDWYARGQDWGLADALTAGQDGNWTLDDIARAFAAGAQAGAAIESKRTFERECRCVALEEQADLTAIELNRLRESEKALVATLRDEMDEGLRLRELGGARPDEGITAMTERIVAENAQLRAQLATFTPLRAKGVVDADDNLDCWDTNPYEICTRHVAALNEKDPAAMWRVVQLFARDEAVPGA